MKPKAATPSVVAVAYSGGRDSTALLHCVLHAAAEAGNVRVAALHVHHGLLPRADDWLAHCERQCAAWARKGWPIEFAATWLHLRPAKGESVEALAREARYRALREMAITRGADAVLLAHHRRDQAETFLLQALRGAGVVGLAAMPRAVEREGIRWLRPWLDHPREDVEAYVRHHRLRYIDDDSNDDVRFARNRLRLAVWPALADAFPHAEVTLADAAEWAQDAAACMEELATLDLEGVIGPKGLQLAALRSLSPARGRNVLRAWFKRESGQGMTASLLTRLWAEIGQAKVATWPSGAGELRLYRGVLSLHAVAVPSAPSPRESSLSIRRAGAYRLPGWGGVLHAHRVAEGGVAHERLQQLQLSAREGGERFQLGTGRPPRSLKKQFQAAAIAAWQREGPLVYDAEGELLFVPGLGVDARAWAQPGERQLSLRWEADRPG